MDEKKKVLFSFVGSRDPYSDGKAKRLWKKFQGRETTSEGSVLTACRWLNPDIVYLFPSSKEKAAQPGNHTEDRANEAREIILSKFGVKECTVMPLMTENATDTTKLYTCLRNNMRRIFNSLTKNYPDEQDCIRNRYELIFILTSGTQQMNESARLFLPSLPYEFQYYTCVAPGYAQGKDRVKPTDLKLADEARLLKSIEANADSYYFHSVIENCRILAEVSVLKMRRDRSKELANLFTAYEDIDSMQYDSAYEKISEAADFYSRHKEEYQEKQPILPVAGIGDVLKRQAEYLKGLWGRVRTNDEGEDVNSLIDLFFNMERAYTRGNYVDVLARFWRLREGMMNFRLLTYHKLDRRNLRKPFISKEDEQTRKANYDRLMKSDYSDRVDANNGWVRNEIIAVVSLLTGFFGDRELAEFENVYRAKLERLQKARNQTIVAHGMLPVSKDAADMCMTLGKEIIKLIPGGHEVYDIYPFKRENIQEVLNLLKYI